MPSAALRPKNPCRASLIEGRSVGVSDRSHPTFPIRGSENLLTLAASGGRPLLTLPRLQGRVEWEQADGTPALQPESTCHMHYFRRACGRWSKRHCGVPANPRTLGESDTSKWRDGERPERAAHDSRPAPPDPPSQARGGREGASAASVESWHRPTATSWRVRPVTLRLFSHDRWFGYVAGRYGRTDQQPGRRRRTVGVCPRMAIRSSQRRRSDLCGRRSLDRLPGLLHVDA